MWELLKTCLQKLWRNNLGMLQRNSLGRRNMQTEESKPQDRRCVYSDFCSGELRQFPFTDWKNYSSVKHRLISYFTLQILSKSIGRRGAVSQINEEL